METTPSDIKIKCYICGTSFDFGNDCPSCNQDTGGQATITGNDCTLCKHFKTNTVDFPNGTCLSDSETVAKMGVHCANFQAK